MIDLFGRAARARVAELEAEMEEVKKNCMHWFTEAKTRADQHSLILKLTADLRRMDQYIYRMGQAMSLPEWQSILKEAQRETEARMREESNRIRSVLLPEIVRTYADHNPQGASETESIRQAAGLEGPRDAVSGSPRLQAPEQHPSDHRLRGAHPGEDD